MPYGIEVVAIRVQERSVYGQKLWYVTDPAQAAALTRLTGKKTVDDGDIRALTDLGIMVLKEISK